MKILMASRGVMPIEAGCGGAEIVSYQLAKTMAESGHDVTFVADLDPKVFEPTPGLSVLPVGGRLQAWVRRLPACLPRWILQHLVGNVAVARTVRKILRRQGDLYAVIHTHGALSTVLISWGTSTPLIYTEHDATPWSCRYRRWYERWIRKAIYRVVNVSAFRRADPHAARCSRFRTCAADGAHAAACELTRRAAAAAQPPTRVVAINVSGYAGPGTA